MAIRRSVLVTVNIGHGATAYARSHFGTILSTQVDAVAHTITVGVCVSNTASTHTTGDFQRVCRACVQAILHAVAITVWYRSAWVYTVQ